MSFTENRGSLRTYVVAFSGDTGNPNEKKASLELPHGVGEPENGHHAAFDVSPVNGLSGPTWRGWKAPGGHSIPGASLAFRVPPSRVDTPAS